MLREKLGCICKSKKPTVLAMHMNKFYLSIYKGISKSCAKNPFKTLGSHHHAPQLGQEGQSPPPPKGTGKGPAKGGKGPPAKGKAKGKEVPVVRCVWWRG